MAIDPEIAEIRATMDDQGKTQAELGRELGLDSSQISRLFSGKRRLQRHEANKVRAWLGLAPPMGNEATILPGPGMVPLYGWVGAASAGRHVIADQLLLGHVARHPGQLNLRDAFALKVADVSMSPRYEPGEIVYVAPNQWPAREQDCVFVSRSGHGYLKRFVRQTSSEIVLYQLNPEEELRFPAQDMMAMHAVVGRG